MRAFSYPEPTPTVLGRFQARFLECVSAQLWGTMEREEALPFGAIDEIQWYCGRPWEIVKVRGTETGFASFEIKAEKRRGDFRITWERYANGKCYAQIIEDAQGFEIFNRCPAIIPPDLEIDPGTYGWRLSRLRGNVFTFTERELSITNVNEKGFITWERTGRYQMVGRRLHQIDILEREWEAGPHGCAYTDWQPAPDKAYPIKKNSDVEFEILLPSGPRRFRLLPLTRSPMGFVLGIRQRIPGRVVPPKRWAL